MKLNHKIIKRSQSSHQEKSLYIQITKRKLIKLIKIMNMASLLHLLKTKALTKTISQKFSMIKINELLLLYIII